MHARGVEYRSELSLLGKHLEEYSLFLKLFARNFHKKYKCGKSGVGDFVYSFLDVVIHYFPCVTGPSTYSIILCTHYILLFTNWLTSFIQYSGGKLGKKAPYAPQTPSLKLIINTVFDLLHACFIKCHQTNEKNNCHHEQKYFFPPPEVPNPSLPG